MYGGVLGISEFHFSDISRTNNFVPNIRAGMYVTHIHTSICCSSCAHGDISCPHGDISCPHGDISCPHGDISCPHGDISCPHGDISCPHGDVSCPHGDITCPHGNISCPHGNTRSSALNYFLYMYMHDQGFP